MIKTLSAVAVAALTMVGGAQAALINNVDLFSTNQASVVDNTDDNSGVGSQVGLGDVTILGGSRELYISQTLTTARGGDSKLGVAGGFLNFSNDAGTASTGVIRWDGANVTTTTAHVPGGLGSVGDSGDINVTGLGGFNLGNALTDSFELVVDFADGGYFFRIDAYTDATHWSTVKIAANQHLAPITSLIPLAAFLDCSNSVPPGPPLVTVTCGSMGAVDFSNLGALQAVLDVDGSVTNLDLSLNQVTVVPEPNAIALVGLALLGAGVASRRRKA